MGAFAGKRILLTGASAGIGLEMAKIFAAEGAHLALLARNPEKLKAAQDAVREAGASVAEFFPCDVRDAGALHNTVAAAQAALGVLDGVVANSGLCLPGRFHEMAIGDVDTQLDTNLKGAYYTCHAALPHLLKSPAPFIAITSSPAGVLPIVGFSAYGATKAGLNMLADTLRMEYAAQGLRVHLLLPPDTDTPGYKNETALYPPETHAVLSGGTLLDAETVARAFVRGIAQGKAEICPAWDARLMMRLHRINKGIWRRYTRTRIRAKK